MPGKLISVALVAYAQHWLYIAYGVLDWSAIGVKNRSPIRNLPWPNLAAGQKL